MKKNYQNKPFVIKKEVILDYKVKDIWDIVVDKEHYEWRKDVKKIEIFHNGNKWIEYYDKKSKWYTNFTLQAKNEYQVYSYKMESKNFCGNWSWQFIVAGKNKTKVIFAEVKFFENMLKKFTIKLFCNGEKIQEEYINNLLTILKTKHSE